MNVLTTDGLRQALLEVRAELRRAPDVIQELELAAESADLVADAAFNKALLQAVGNVEERKAIARMGSRGERDDAVVRRAAFNRAKLKVKLLETEVMMLQSVLKSVQAET